MTLLVRDLSADLHDTHERSDNGDIINGNEVTCGDFGGNRAGRKR